MTDALPLTTVKNRLSEIVDRVNRDHDRVIVTRNGIPAAVVMSVDELESLEESLEILSDKESVEAIRESELQITKGLEEPVSEDEARARWAR